MFFNSTTKYIILRDFSIREALKFQNENDDKFLIVVDNNGKLVGVVTDGDIRRWIIQTGGDVEQTIEAACNKFPIVLVEGATLSPQLIKHNVYPVVDDDRQVIGVYRSKVEYFEFGDREIGNGRRTFVIAEAGNNHNGSMENAIKLVDQAKRIGADCVKFQMRQLEHTYRSRGLNGEGEDLSTEYTLDQLKKFELSGEQQFELMTYCKSQGILYLCTPWDIPSVDLLETFDVPAYKVASADLRHKKLIEKLSKTLKPLILSTGMSLREDVQKTANLLNSQGVAYALLHCNSTYPAPFQDIHLRWMDDLKSIHPIIGYSGHERGISVSLAAVAMGACIIERHLTLDRNMEGADHAASLELEEFKALVDGIREIELALGDKSERRLSQGEMINRENLAKSLMSARQMKIGDVIGEEDILIKSPGQGLSPAFFDELVGKTIKRSMKKEDFFFESDLVITEKKNKNFTFSRDWGVPVRYHDFAEYLDMVKPDLLEFHFSYADLKINVSDVFKTHLNHDLVVHAPELFENSELLDLASLDEAYRQRSIFNLQKVVDITRQMKEFFPTEKPLIITNVGGGSLDVHLSCDERRQLYQILEKSLSEINSQGVEIIPQTMPPFPWHFGGQRFHNLFVHADEIADFCEKNAMRVCYDVSHSYLACNEFGYNINEFSKIIGPYAAHLHIADALDKNGEGLQIGDGEMDFTTILAKLSETCPNASFIPEIWQGHKNAGEGFWLALSELSTLYPDL